MRAHTTPSTDRFRPIRHRLELVWCRPRLAITTAIGVAALWGLMAGWWMPRGPLTTAQALWSIAIGLAVGAFAGAVMRSRWAMLLAPVAFMAVFELMRMGLDGPTVDRVRISTYGLLALAVGRIFHGLVALAPIVWAAALGAGFARELDTARRPVAGTHRHRYGRYARRSLAALTGIALVALSVGIARPARTDAIVGPDGRPLDGSIAELTSVNIDGHELSMMVRGHDVENPVLLFLAGGPGGSELGAMRNHLPELEEHFVVVTWDQRGTGKSYPQLDPTSTLTLDRVVADTLAVTDHLLERFDRQQLYLLGQSWGTTLGVLAVQERPDAYAAFIGTGQMVSQLATDTIFYDDTIEWAEATGREGLADELLSIGPPPYSDMLDYETALSYEHQVYPYDRTPNSEGIGGFSENFLVEEYTLIEQVHLLAGFMDTFSVLYPQLQHIDFRTDATRVEVPMYFVQGANEAAGRAIPFAEWYEILDAPVKELVVLDTSGHRPLFEQPDEFVAFMTDVVLDR
jgi:proline iminopeptidase